jgi:hypothetical protein
MTERVRGAKKRPSYERGKFRDPKIADQQDPTYDREDFERLARKAARSREKPKDS